MSNFKAKMH